MTLDEIHRYVGQGPTVAHARSRTGFGNLYCVGKHKRYSNDGKKLLQISIIESRTFFTGNQLESIASWSLNDPIKVSMTVLMLNMHTAEPLMAFTGVLNTPYTIGSMMPVKAVFIMLLVPSEKYEKNI